MGFQPMIPAFKPAKTVHALDREATVIGTKLLDCAKPEALELDFSFLKTY
jgi:hypothetical protein